MVENSVTLRGLVGSWLDAYGSMYYIREETYGPGLVVLTVRPDGSRRLTRRLVRSRYRGELEYVTWGWGRRAGYQLCTHVASRIRLGRSPTYIIWFAVSGRRGHGRPIYVWIRDSGTSPPSPEYYWCYKSPDSRCWHLHGHSELDDRVRHHCFQIKLKSSFFRKQCLLDDSTAFHDP